MEAVRLLQPSFHVALEFGSRQFPLIHWHLLWYIQSLSACRMAQALDYSLRAWDSTLCVRGTVLFVCVGQYSLRAWDSTLCVRGTVLFACVGQYSLRAWDSGTWCIQPTPSCFRLHFHKYRGGVHVYM